MDKIMLAGIASAGTVLVMVLSALLMEWIVGGWLDRRAGRRHDEIDGYGGYER